MTPPRYLLDIDDAGDRDLVHVFAPGDEDAQAIVSTEKAARRILSQPDLLKAAKRALATLKAQGESVRPGNVLHALQVAITKAEGGAP